VRLAGGKDQVILATQQGKALRFPISKVRPMGRQAAGVKAITIKGKDQLAGMEIVETGGDLLVVTTKGYGKRTSLKQYAAKGRGTSGMLTIDVKALSTIGHIAAVRVVQAADEVTIISTGGVVLRTKVKDIKQAGRATRGVRLMNVASGDSVATLARIAEADLKRVGASQENGKEEK
jgi:DNA gyrase subunit A